MYAKWCILALCWNCNFKSRR